MHNYMEYQQEINWKMRRTLIEWLIEVHLEYDLRPETLFLGVNIMDRYLSRRVVPKLEFQLLGVTALWLAAKYEEIHGKVPSLQKLSYVCCNAYREQDFVQMELRLLNELGFSLGHPTAETFLKHHCAMLKAQAEQVGADPTENIALARYLMELTLVHKRFMSARPSVIALASFLLADRLTGKCTWVGSRASRVGLKDRKSLTSLLSFALPFFFLFQACQDELLLYMVDEIQDCIPNASRTIYEKYSKPRYSNASMLAKHYLQQGLQSSARGVQVPPPSIHTGFSKPSNPYPSPPSRFGDSRSASTETLVDQCWTSPSVAAHKQQQQHQPAMVMQQIAFVPTSTVVYSVGYLQPQVPVSDPMWRV